MARKNKKTKGRRNLQAKLAAEKARLDALKCGKSYAQLAEENKKLRRSQVMKESASDAYTKKPLFKGSDREWNKIAPNWQKVYEQYPRRQFYYEQALATSFVEEFGCSGILFTTPYAGYSHYFTTVNSEAWHNTIGNGFVNGHGVTRDSSAFFTRMVEDLEELGHKAVVVATYDPTLPREKRERAFSFYVIGSDSSTYDCWSEDNYYAFYDHTSQLLQSGGDDIRIAPLYSYEELVDKAISSYNNHKARNPIANPRSLPFENLRRIVMNYLRHNCTEYDDVWKSCQKRVDLLHRLFKLRTNKAIAAAYPELDSYLRDFLKPRKAA